MRVAIGSKDSNDDLLFPLRYSEPDVPDGSRGSLIPSLVLGRTQKLKVKLFLRLFLSGRWYIDEVCVEVVEQLHQLLFLPVVQLLYLM